MKHSEIYNDAFITRITNLFPATQDWFAQETKPSGAIDVESLITAMGFKLKQRILKSNVHSELVGNVIFLNIEDSKEAQRFAITHQIGQILTTEKHLPKMPVQKITEPMPQVVLDFLGAINFEPKTTNSLVSAIRQLDNYSQSALVPDDDPIVNWYASDSAEIQLAQFYLSK